MHFLSHDHEHPHHHDEPAGPGQFQARRAPIDRDYRSRAFTVGVGGPVGSGKTALLLALCRASGSTRKPISSPPTARSFAPGRPTSSRSRSGTFFSEAGACLTG